MQVERSWIVLADNGQHTTLGRETDPSEQEILRLQDQLTSLGMGGWLAVTEGAYYSDDRVTLLQVRTLGKPGIDRETACARFHQIREAGPDSVGSPELMP